MSRTKKFYLIISALFLITTGLVFAGEVLAFLKLSDIAATLAEQRYRIVKLTEEEENLKTLSSRYEKIESDLNKITVALPDQKDTSKLLSDLDSLAGESGLKLTLIQTNSYGKKQTGVTDPALLQTIKGKYGYELPLEVKVTGSYQSFTSFIKRVENYQRLLNINGIEITKMTDTSGNSDKIEAKLRLTAYLMK